MTVANINASVVADVDYAVQELSIKPRFPR